ncbi:hypothetical protein BX666DRAFT_1997421 [Dichotomocladium elegans]|nr:hypothetical protein BX666DRAFT_1997421 [Dichotomocladium elegans]
MNTKEQPSDIEWCIRNAHNLSLPAFADQFGYEERRRANNRYLDILRSSAFSECRTLGRLLKDFREWRGSNEVKVYWDARKASYEETVSRIQLQRDGMKTARAYALTCGKILRRSKSEGDL